MFKVLLLSILCLGAFGYSVMNAATSKDLIHQETIKNLGMSLQKMASNGLSREIKALFQGGAFSLKVLSDSVQYQDPETGYTAFTCASLKGDVKALKALAEPFKGRIELLKKIVMTYTKNFNTALILAADEGKVDVVRAILELFKEDKKSLKDVVVQQYSSRETALSKASLGGHIDVIKALLEPFLGDLDSYKEVVMQEVGEAKINVIVAAALVYQEAVVAVLLGGIVNNKELYQKCLNICLSQARKTGHLGALGILNHYSETMGKIPSDRPGIITISCYYCHKCPPGGAPLLFCSGCQANAYCNATCQGADWQNHKKFCKDIQIQRKRLASAAAAATGSGSGGAASSH